MRLIGDIGGTYARFALQRRRGQFGLVQVFEVAQFADLETAIRAYLGGRRVQEAVLAVATPVEHDVIRFTNNPWQFSREALRARLKLKRLAVLNDFVAQALAVAHLTEAELAPIGGGSRLPQRPAVVLGPGTGLGCAILTWNGPRPQPMASEAGHMSFAPEDESELAVLAELRRTHGHVSYERLLSGPGLVATAQALARLSGTTLALAGPAEVVQRAQAQGCRHCCEALRIFSGALGGFAGNLALTVLARGGVYLVGALLDRLGAAFDAARFRSRFEAKGRLAEILREIPTLRVLREETGLLGASYFSFRAADSAPARLPLVPPV